MDCFSKVRRYTPELVAFVGLALAGQQMLEEHLVAVFDIQHALAVVHLDWGSWRPKWVESVQLGHLWRQVHSRKSFPPMKCSVT